MTSRRDSGNFWQTLPAAVLAWLLALWGVGHFLVTPSNTEQKPEVVEERLVELPEPPKAEVPPPPTPQPKTPPPPQPLPQPALAAPVQAPPPPPAAAKAEPPAPPPPPPPPPAPAQTAAPAAGVENHGPRLENLDPSGALPDSVLAELNGHTVTVHIAVAADGSATVTVTDPSISPVARRAIADEIRKSGKFSPAVHNGQPVASTQDVQLPF